MSRVDKSIIVNVDENFHYDLKLHCLKNNITIKKFVLQAIQQKFKEEIKKEPN